MAVAFKTNVIEELGIDSKAILLIEEINFHCAFESEKRAFVDTMQRKISLHKYSESMIPRVIFQMLLELRSERLMNQRISLLEFIKGYETERISALECLFMEPISCAKLARLDKAQMTAEDIFWAHQQNKEYTLMEMLAFRK